MSPRRPDITYEEAAAAAGVDPSLEKLFDDVAPTTVADENKPLLGRRVTLVIQREGVEFDKPMKDDIVAALVRYCGVLLAGGAGHHAHERYVFKQSGPGGDEIEPILLTVDAESYELEVATQPENHQ